jgi:hypothetical protein
MQLKFFVKYFSALESHKACSFRESFYDCSINPSQEQFITANFSSESRLLCNFHEESKSP